MRVSMLQVDAFTRQRFHGNPAAVCRLDHWLPDETLLALANENNLSETAYLVRAGEHEWHLRWFTPQVEVNLCGHATLAAAHALFTAWGAPGDTVCFHTRSGQLPVTRQGEDYCLDFPISDPETVAPPALLVQALGLEPVEILAAEDYIAVLETAEQVRAVKPDLQLLAQLDRRGVVVTAPGDDCDFVSRFFGPKLGIAEDPVTGSAHCALAPFWGWNLSKAVLRARQVSARGGELRCELRGDRVALIGAACTVFETSFDL